MVSARAQARRWRLIGMGANLRQKVANTGLGGYPDPSS
jgi:hypothetical protein